MQKITNFKYFKNTEFQKFTFSLKLISRLYVILKCIMEIETLSVQRLELLCYRQQKYNDFFHEFII